MFEDQSWYFNGDLFPEQAMQITIEKEGVDESMTVIEGNPFLVLQRGLVP